MPPKVLGRATTWSCVELMPYSPLLWGQHSPVSKVTLGCLSAPCPPPKAQLGPHPARNSRPHPALLAPSASDCLIGNPGLSRRFCTVACSLRVLPRARGSLTQRFRAAHDSGRPLASHPRASLRVPSEGPLRSLSSLPEAPAHRERAKGRPLGKATFTVTVVEQGH